MASNSRTLKLSILADIENLTKGLNQGSKETEDFATKAVALGKKIAGAFVVKEIVDFGTQVAKAAMEEEASVAKLNQTLIAFTGATQGQIEANKGFIDTLSVQTAIADDDLRPAMARLARSLGDVEAAQKATDLAARISVNTGKDVETVANAMAKAADGQTGALAKLGLGFGAAELKGKSFAEITDMLNGKFPTLGANADTTAFKFKQFQNFIENTKESIGAALLPILTKFFEFTIQNLNPALERVAKLFEPIIKAIQDNKQAFQDLGNFMKDVILPVVIFVMEQVVSKTAQAVEGIIKLFGGIERLIKPVIDRIIGFINDIIEAYNRLPFKDIPTIGGSTVSGGANFGRSAGSAGATNSALVSALGAASSGVASLGLGGTGTGGSGGGINSAAAQKALDQLQSDSATLNTMLEFLTSPTFTDAATNARNNAMGAYYNITVNGAIDAEGTAQTIVNTLQDSIDRGGVAASFIPRNQL